MTEWLAYCAKDHKVSATLCLALRGEQVSDIREHPWLEGDEIVLVNPEALQEPPDLPWTMEDPLHGGLLGDWRRRELRRFAGAQFPPPWIDLVRTA